MHLVQHFQETVSAADKVKTGRPYISHDDKPEQNVLQCLPTENLRKLVMQEGISYVTVQKAAGKVAITSVICMFHR